MNYEACPFNLFLMTVCDVIIAVRGNPLMRKFGEDLKSKLEG